MVGAIMNIFGQPCRDDIFLASAQYRTIANQSAPSPSLSFPRCWTEVSAERRGSVGYIRLLLFAVSNQDLTSRINLKCVSPTEEYVPFVITDQNT
jgi:hypothetical protein